MVRVQGRAERKVNTRSLPLGQPDQANGTFRLNIAQLTLNPHTAIAMTQ